ncbi:MAG: Rrf2 family transcriptional regulator [Candidatus Omnitrophica bacterium]|nr:Rrf2 family transcriptional regulator [Candidatus Omnitrophota bacterium]
MLTKTGKQVVNALVELAKLKEGEWLGVGVIARRIRAPQNYLGKILQGLVSSGIVVSQKGLGGGFRLGKAAGQITLYDAVEPVENVSVWSECALGLKKCSDAAPCAVHHQWKGVKETYLKFLENTTVASLAQSGK